MNGIGGRQLNWGQTGDWDCPIAIILNNDSTVNMVTTVL